MGVGDHPVEMRNMSSAQRYKAAGVDLDAADRVKQRIRRAVSSTATTHVLSAFGAFGGVVRIPADVDHPAIVLSTDGVGTKVLVAVRAGRHDTVGEDLVNHCVNDVLVHGARPLAFLDYIGGSALETDVIASIVEGVARACRAHDMALVGGETAQLAELYDAHHYDLVGTIVGLVDASKHLPGNRVRVGDVLIGYESSGLHTNGYTLARRILFDDLGLSLDATIPDLDRTVGDALLTVHRSYWRSVAPNLERLHALAHITGGGIPGNLGRSLPEGLGARVERSSWPVPPLFEVLERGGNVSEDEMYRVFNMGIGMIGVVPADDAEAVCATAETEGVRTWVIGEIASEPGVRLG